MTSGGLLKAHLYEASDGTIKAYSKVQREFPTTPPPSEASVTPEDERTPRLYYRVKHPQKKG